MAADGVGLGGRTTDKSVTFFCFGVIALFMLLPIVLSLIQGAPRGPQGTHARAARARPPALETGSRLVLNAGRTSGLRSVPAYAGTRKHLVQFLSEV